MSAWATLVELYHRRPCRAAWEMRHLLLQGFTPTHLGPASMNDLPLASALIGWGAPLTRATWTQLWTRSLPRAGTPMGRNLQARLLNDAIRLAQDGGGLPDGFPAEPAQPDVLWAQLRTAALIAVRAPRARAQAALLNVKKDVISARLVASAAALEKDWVAAAAPPALPAEERRYVLDVLADDAALEKLLQQGGALAKSAAMSLATRRLGEGDWAAGAKVFESVDAPRAALWREAGKRSAEVTPKGRLAFAKWVQSARLFDGYDTAYSRGLRSRLDTIGAHPELAAEGERERLEYFLLRTGPRQRALEAFAAAFPLFPIDSARKPLVSEADKIFNSLLNWDVGGSEAYPALLRASPPVKALLLAGRPSGN